MFLWGRRYSNPADGFSQAREKHAPKIPAHQSRASLVDLLELCIVSRISQRSTAHAHNSATGCEIQKSRPAGFFVLLRPAVKCTSTILQPAAKSQFTSQPVNSTSLARRSSILDFRVSCVRVTL